MVGCDNKNTDVKSLDNDQKTEVDGAMGKMEAEKDRTNCNQLRVILSYPTTSEISPRHEKAVDKAQSKTTEMEM